MSTTTTEQKPMTAEEFWELHESDSGFRGELIYGEVREMVPPGGQHGDIASQIIIDMGIYLRSRNIGRVYTETGYVLRHDPDVVAAPDVSFIRAERAPSRKEKKWLEVAPDLAVEVISPSDNYSDVHQKTELYLENGVEEVWIVDPRRESIDVLRADSTKTYGGNDTLTTPLLPGFALVVKSLFE